MGNPCVTAFFCEVADEAKRLSRAGLFPKAHPTEYICMYEAATDGLPDWKLFPQPTRHRVQWVLSYSVCEENLGDGG